MAASTGESFVTALGQTWKYLTGARLDRLQAEVDSLSEEAGNA
ncbi:hypothetical protein [Bradyrhizobium sp. Leo170]|nr:hypothetical protein [Bradyrhizobium sp. Leo170]